MLKKCALFIRGFVRLRAILIILILAVTAYVYQDKIRKVSVQFFEAKSQSGPLFYTKGIWNKMKRIQNISDSRSRRAIEIFEEKKIVNEKSGLFSLEIPKSWNVVLEEGVAVNQISEMVIESPSFSKRLEESDIFYEDGAQLHIKVIKGEQPNAKLPDGGYGPMLIKKGIVNMAEGSTTYYIVKDANVKQGEIIEAHILHDGNTYNLRLMDNPQAFIDGEIYFQELLQSFKFRK